MKNLKHDAQIVKRAWVTPSVTELPRLTDLTLQSSGGDAVISGAIQGSGNASTGTFAF
jgi:hypothetical protein